MLRTALVEEHRARGARLIDFAGWEMPLQYRGILDEHRAVRERAGLFDLSHMGEVWVSGPGAGNGLARALITDPPRLSPGRAHYSMICTPDGGIIDDLIVYRLAEDRFLIVPNAANREAVVKAFDERLSAPDALVDDASLRTSLLAVQGPQALELLTPLTDVDLAQLRYYAIAEGHVGGQPALVARTGYTGEDGFELFLDWTAALPAWQALLEAGEGVGLQPCGLGARDTLRLEAGMPLYGNELDLDANPFEPGLGRLVKFDKPDDFIGRAALQQVADEGPRRKLVGLVLRGRAIARHGAAVHLPGGEEQIGVVTSGAPSPTLGMPIAMAYLPPRNAEPATMVEVAVRAARIEAEVVPLPFYKRTQ